MDCKNKEELIKKTALIMARTNKDPLYSIAMGLSRIKKRQEKEYKLQDNKIEDLCETSLIKESNHRIEDNKFTKKFLKRVIDIQNKIKGGIKNE